MILAGAAKDEPPMQVAPEIVFKNFEAAPHVRERVAHEVARLGKFNPRITSCRVVVERATGRRKTGDLYRASIFLALPGGREVAATRSQDDAHAHEDVLVAVRDAFDAAQRRVEDQTRVQRGDVKRPRRGVKQGD